jgi:hypothetical protein
LPLDPNQWLFMLIARQAVWRDIQNGPKQKGRIMSTETKRYAMTLGAAAVFGIAGACAIAPASPALAAPILPDTAAVKMAASSQITDVRYYGRGYYRRGYYGRGYYPYGYYGGAAAAGLALGAAAAAPYYAPYYYPYYYGPRAYYAPYGYPYPW